MKQLTAYFVPLSTSLLLTGPVLAAGGFYGDPPDATHPWAVHDMNRPQPPRVDPGSPSTQEQPGRPPSDAVVLFDGTPASLANWESEKHPGQPTEWEVKDGALQCKPGSGYIRTKEMFGDCQLHVEWSAPAKVAGNGQGRGNSGIFLAGGVEVQVLDNFDNPTYADGSAGSVYGVNPPYAEASHGPGKWQVYEIIFRRPVFKDGKMLDSGRLTVLMNGVVLQDSTPLEGGGGHKRRSKDRPYPEAGPLKLQDHGNPVRFRNIWYRPLPKRAVEGGDMGAMDPAAATAKKQEIARQIRLDAESKDGKERLRRVMESLCYDPDPEAVKAVDAGLAKWVASAKQIPASGMAAKKGEIIQMFRDLRYLTQFKLYADQGGCQEEMAKIIQANGWKP